MKTETHTKKLRIIRTANIGMKGGLFGLVQFGDITKYILKYIFHLLSFVI